MEPTIVVEPFSAINFTTALGIEIPFLSLSLNFSGTVEPGLKEVQIVFVKSRLELIVERLV